MPSQEKCLKCVTTISWIGLADSLFLAMFKGIIGILTGSRALTASALYSLNDVISGVAVLIGLRISSKPADKNHPYGHGKAEYMVAVFTSILIMGATVFLLGDSFRIIFRDEHSPVSGVALVAALVSIVANEVIYRYNICGVKHINSPALVAHAKHHRADAISSVAVAVAIGASVLGYHFLDAIVAVFEAGHLLLVSAEILHKGSSGLMDCAIKESDVSSIREVVSAMSDVKEVKDIKTRQIGRNVWVDLYVSLPSNKTIMEVDSISDEIRQRIAGRVNHLGNVNVVCV